MIHFVRVEPQILCVNRTIAFQQISSKYSTNTEQSCKYRVSEVGEGWTREERWMDLPEGIVLYRLSGQDLTGRVIHPQDIRPTGCTRGSVLPYTHYDLCCFQSNHLSVATRVNSFEVKLDVNQSPVMMRYQRTPVTQSSTLT